MAPILAINNVKLTIDEKLILKGINLIVRKGEIHAILGPNGAGKSTLAKLIMGIDNLKTPTEGEIVFDGKIINGLEIYERARLGITLAWQEPARFEGITIEEYLKLSGKNNPNVDIKKCLEKVGLVPELYLKRYVDESLSGGERKRVELASILALKPKFVILDEIDSGIDFTSIEDIQKILETMRDEGITILMITHNEKLLDVADRASLLCAGKVLDTSDPQTIKRKFEECKVCDVLDFELKGEKDGKDR
ncbi:ABC transporter related protein [Desulfurobacterium thermolithotrophum DSM 11699]|uniref:ABC transporter related protein n=1 Tax=Desulfurobacterium thermolithotrophum (strain DSM 11699 / BSA) TaxID=868864 RepID=F0S318_DESTD|nr:ABC transporter ATP-binding protein [Desulfurobacterium thermolithotrophum]ADY73240.1 ABC transporter related protein [Desulfurobacterium thermolithotrophum DSM 11699]